MTMGHLILDVYINMKITINCYLVSKYTRNVDKIIFGIFPIVCQVKSQSI